MRSWLAAMDRDWDLDAVMRFFASDIVWDLPVAGLGIYEGAAAVRSFMEGWWATWEDHEWAHGKIVRITLFARRREARAAAERLAEERG